MGKGDRANTHTHTRTHAVGRGEGGAYTFNVQVKCEAYAPRNVRVSASVYQCVSVYHCISVSPGTLYICMCVCWDAAAAASAAALERCYVFFCSTRARGLPPSLMTNFSHTHAHARLLPVQRKTNTQKTSSFFN